MEHSDGSAASDDETASPESVLCHTASTLSLITQRSVYDCEKVLLTTSEQNYPLRSVTHESVESIRTLSFACSSIDAYLGGQLKMEGIVEIHGEAGSGKTQMSLQLIKSFLTSRASGEKCLYISTEGPFPSTRLAQICGDQISADFMDDVYVEHVDAAENILILFESQTDFPSLVVIDSIAAPFRVLEYERRNRLLSKLIGRLLFLAHDDRKGRRLIFCVNQMTNDENRQLPALGRTWEESLTTRIEISRIEGLISKETGACVRKLNVVFSENVQCRKDCQALFSPGQNGLVAYNK